MVRVELEDDEEMAPKLEGNEVVCRDILKPILVTLFLELGGQQYKQERERRVLSKMEGNELLFSSKRFPRIEIFLGENQDTAGMDSH